MSTRDLELECGVGAVDSSEGSIVIVSRKSVQMRRDEHMRAVS